MILNRIKDRKTLVFFILAMMTVVAFSLLVYIVRGTLTSTSFFALFLIFVWTLWLEHQTIALFFANTARKLTDCFRDFFSVVIPIVVAAIVLEACTILGESPSRLLSVGSWHAPRIAIFFYVLYSIWTVFAFFDIHPKRLLNRIPEWCVSRRKEIIFWSSAVACSVALTLIVAFFVHKYLFVEISYFRTWIVIFSVAFSVFMIVYAGIKRTISIANLFLVVALLFGSCFALGEPVASLMSWDDQIHYSRAKALSYVMCPEYSEADMELMNMSEKAIPASKYLVESNFDDSQRADYLNQIDKTGTVSMPGRFTAWPDVSMVNITMVAYIPSAIGLWLGRLIQLPFTYVYALGRFFNLLFYCLVAFFAIKIIPTKKVFLAVVALIPENIYLASNYTYDTWITALIFLFTALLIRELASENTKISRRVWPLLLLVPMLAFFPKAIYFPLLGLLFLLPKQKFASSKQHIQFNISVIITVLILVISFVVPFAASGGSDMSDARGGTEVNASLQVAGILAQPLYFVKVIAKYLGEVYLSVSNVPDVMTNFAYLGGNLVDTNHFGWAAGLLCLFIVMACLIDSDRKSSGLANWKSRTWVLMIFFIICFLLATALYVSFTAVGSDTVAGCQGRYLLPLVFPVMCLCCSFNMVNQTNIAIRGSWLIAGSFVLLFASVLCFIWCVIGVKIIPY